MEDRIVEINAQIEESRLDQLEAFLNNLGVKFTIQKQLTFEDLGLVEVETGLFQCLVCSKMNKRKHNAVAHFKKQHTNQVMNMNSFVKWFENMFLIWFVCLFTRPKETCLKPLILSILAMKWEIMYYFISNISTLIFIWGTSLFLEYSSIDFDLCKIVPFKFI